MKNMRKPLNKNFNHNINKDGFTLIELLLYVALVSIFITGAVLFAWDIIFGQAKAEILRTVNQEMRFVSQRIMYEIRNAQDINQASASTLSLSMSQAERDPTIIDLSGGQIRIGIGSGGSCPTTNPCALTSDQVVVDALNFIDLSSSTDSKNVKFTVEMSTHADRREWQHQQTYTGAAELRSNQ
jgi:prepilin-type N-terminal cleavage/methylation domain-containing protein